MERNASAVRRSRGLNQNATQLATTPVPPSIKLWGNGFPAKLAVDGKWKVLLIVHPMVMGFDGITQFLHHDLMKIQRSLELRTLINQAIKLFFEKVVKKVVKGWVQSHCIPLVSFVQLRPCRKTSSISMSFSRVFSMISSSPASLAFSSSKFRWNAVIAGSRDFR